MSPSAGTGAGGLHVELCVPNENHRAYSAVSKQEKTVSPTDTVASLNFLWRLLVEMFLTEVIIYRTVIGIISCTGTGIIHVAETGGVHAGVRPDGA
jgi:hypothetical protein